MAKSFVIVVSSGGELAPDEDASLILRQLGAEVRRLELWQDAADAFSSDDDRARAVVVESGSRPDVGALALRGLRKEPRLEGVGALLSVSHKQVHNVDPGAGFDDMILCPYVPAELYARLRALEWRRSEFSNEERIKLGDIVIDRAAREVTIEGGVAKITMREFDLLVYLADQRGRVVSRAELLERVWGESYDGGTRTIDIHVTRLRNKLGSALVLLTFRGSGYRLGKPGEREG